MNEKKKLNNKGFSLVELIFVIAIMAILVGVLAPQYMKYLDKTRKSTDVQAAQTIATAVNVALASEATVISADSQSLTELYTAVTDTTDADGNFTSGDAFQREIKSTLGDNEPKPKFDPKVNVSFYIDIDDTGTTKTAKIYVTDDDDNMVELYPNVDDTYR